MAVLDLKASGRALRARDTDLQGGHTSEAAAALRKGYGQVLHLCGSRENGQWSQSELTQWEEGVFPR